VVERFTHPEMKRRIAGLVLRGRVSNLLRRGTGDSMAKEMKSKIVIGLAICASFLFVGVSNAADPDIYVRVGLSGVMEFTDCPSGPGWVFYRKESGHVPTINFFQGDKPKKVDDIIREIAKEYAIDSALVRAIVTVESNSDPLAISRKGAQGLMQLMPATARDLNVSRPLDPRENIIGGVKYIKGLLAAYGDLRLALAGYNAGPGAVKKYAGIPPYRETITYVKKVLKYYNRFKKEEKLRVAEG